MFYIALAWVVYVFFIHGVKGIHGAESFIAITSVLGFSAAVTSTLVFFVGVLDIFVAFALVVFPHKLFLVWAVVWPWVPFVMIQYAGGHTHVEEFFLTSVGACIALMLLPQQTLGTYIRHALIQRDR